MAKSFVSHLRWDHGISRNVARKIRDKQSNCPYCLLYPGSGIMTTGSELDTCFCKREK